MKLLKGTFFIVLAVLGLALMVLVLNIDSFKRGFKRGWERQEATLLASAMADSAQSMLPIQLNEYTKVIAVTFEKNKVIYLYTVSLESQGQPDIDELREVVLYNVCNGIKIRKILDRGVLFSYIYKTERTNRWITTIEIGKEDCVSLSGP